MTPTDFGSSLDTTNAEQSKETDIRNKQKMVYKLQFETHAHPSEWKYILKDTT